MWGELCQWSTEFSYYSYHGEPMGWEFLVPARTLIVLKLLRGLPDNDKMARLLLGGVTRVALANSGVDTSQKQLCLTRPSCLARYKIYVGIRFTHLIYPHFTHNFDTLVKQMQYLRLFIQTHYDYRCCNAMKRAKQRRPDQHERGFDEPRHVLKRYLEFPDSFLW